MQELMRVEKLCLGRCKMFYDISQRFLWIEEMVRDISFDEKINYYSPYKFKDKKVNTRGYISSTRSRQKRFRNKDMVLEIEA